MGRMTAPIERVTGADYLAESLMDLRKRDSTAICAAGSRSDVCARQPGQVRKEAATTGCGGSAGSFTRFPAAFTALAGDFQAGRAYLMGDG